MDSHSDDRYSSNLPTEFRGVPAAIADYIRNSIFERELQVGQPLRQKDIADACGASRVPVREALKQLEAEGLAEFRPRRGYIVAGFDLEEIADIFLVRKFVEEHAGYLAARNRTAEDIREIEGLMQEMDRSLTTDPESVQRFAISNRLFHQRLSAASKRRQLVRILDNLRGQVERYVRLDSRTPGRLEEAQQEHRAIVQALREGDAARLSTLCGAHAQHTADRLLKTLKERLDTQPR